MLFLYVDVAMAVDSGRYFVFKNREYRIQNYTIVVLKTEKLSNIQLTNFFWLDLALPYPFNFLKTTKYVCALRTILLLLLSARDQV